MDIRGMKTEDLRRHIEESVAELANRSVPDILDILTHWAREAGGPRYAWDLTRSSVGYTLCVYDSESGTLFDDDDESVSVLVARASVELHGLCVERMAAVGTVVGSALRVVNVEENRP